MNPMMHQWWHWMNHSFNAASMVFHCILCCIIIPTIGISMVPSGCINGIQLDPLLLSFFPLVFQWFCQAELMVFHWILCCIIIPCIGLPMFPLCCIDDIPWDPLLLSVIPLVFHWFLHAGPIAMVFHWFLWHYHWFNWYSFSTAVSMVNFSFHALTQLNSNSMLAWKDCKWNAITVGIVCHSCLFKKNKWTHYRVVMHLYGRWIRLIILLI